MNQWALFTPRGMDERWRSEDGGEGLQDEGGMDQGGWGRGYGGGGGDEVGVLSRKNNECTRMERVEHSTNIGHNVMNEDGIEYSKVLSF